MTDRPTEPILVADLRGPDPTAAVVRGSHWQLVDAAITADDPAVTLSMLHRFTQARYDARVDRLMLTSPVEPSPGQVGGALLAAGDAAGFLDVELLHQLIAVTLDPAAGPAAPSGTHLLACDLDQVWSVGLVRTALDHPQLLSSRTAPPGVPPDGQLRWLVETARRLSADAGRAPAALALSGLWAQHQDLVGEIARALPFPLRVATQPELAGLRGLIRWAGTADRRRLAAAPPRWRETPVSWPLPQAETRLLRWSVAAGGSFRRGEVIAQVRTPADRVLDLTAPTDGVLLGHPAPIGARLGAALVAPVAGDDPQPPPHLHRWSSTGGWLLTGDRLVEWDRTGSRVRTRSPVDGAVVGEIRPDHGPADPDRATVMVDPDGHLCLLAWDLSGEFAVWDLTAGELRHRFHGPAGADRVLVDEQRWRLAAESPDSVSVGRYRRTGVTLWDLRTGRRLDRVIGDDWRRRHPDYTTRSTADRLTTDALSPDRGLRATVDAEGLTVREVATDRVLFRPAAQPDLRVRTAFTADGGHLVGCRETDDRSEIDVWRL